MPFHYYLLGCDLHRGKRLSIKLCETAFQRHTSPTLPKRERTFISKHERCKTKIKGARIIRRRFYP